MPPKSQGSKVVPSSHLQVTFCVDKGSTTPLLLGTKAEKVQIEHEEEPQQVSIDEISKEGKISEKP